MAEQIITIYLEQLPITIEILPPPPPPPPPVPPVADVKVRVDTTKTVINQLEQCLAIVTNEHIYPAAQPVVDKMAPYMRELYSQISFHLSGGFGTSDSWQWNPAKGPKPLKPTIHPSLLAMTALAAKFGKNPLLTAFRPSWHQKIVRGTPLTFVDEYAQEKGRLGGQYKDEWRLMLFELITAVAIQTLRDEPDATFDVEVHNEFKGMWELLQKDKLLVNQNWADGENAGTPGYGDMDYGPYYDLCVQGCIEGFRNAGVGLGRLRFGGPYAVLQSRGLRTANALPSGHPLADRPWGHMSKMPIYAIERFLQYVKKHNSPLHYLVVDGGLHNNDDVFITDVWGQLKKVSEANYYLRFLLDQYGFYRTPIWWAERYLTDRPLPGTTAITQFQDSMPRRASVLAAGLCEMAISGANKIFQWGYRGEDGDPFYDRNHRENAAYFTAAGEPTLLYDTCLLFKKSFPVGCALHPLIVDSPDIDGMGSDDVMLLYNKTDKSRLVETWGQLINLGPCNVAVVTR